jgi:hypothetical protein
MLVKQFFDGRISFSLVAGVPRGRAYNELASAEGHREPPEVKDLRMKRENRYFTTVTRIQPMLYFGAYFNRAT